MSPAFVLGKICCFEIPAVEKSSNHLVSMHLRLLRGSLIPPGTCLGSIRNGGSSAVEISPSIFFELVCHEVDYHKGGSDAKARDVQFYDAERFH